MKQVNQILQKDLEIFLNEIDIKVQSITFIPIGEESYAWKVTTQNEVLFLKYCTQEIIYNNLPKINKLLLSLKKFDFIVPPVLLNGQTEIRFKDGFIYAYPFIEGEVYTIGNEEFDASLVKELTSIMAELHRVGLTNIDIRKENFDYPFEKQFKRILEEIENGKVISEVAESDLAKVTKMISDFEIMSNIYRQNSPIMVLAHGDITGRNILRTTDGKLKLLDWDESKISPKEKDINFLYDNKNFDFKYYQSLTNATDFNTDLSNYYGYVWDLESIIENLERLQDYKQEYGSREVLLEDISDYLGNHYRPIPPFPL